MSVGEPIGLTLYRLVDGLRLELLDLIPIIFGRTVVSNIPSSGKEKPFFEVDGYKLSIDDARLLEARELVEIKVVDRYLACPHCYSTNLRLKIYCPYCGSVDVVFTRIVQHTLCGFTSLEVDFEKAGWRCPNCGATLRPETDLAEIGRIFYCYACQRRFSRPLLRLACQSCNTEFEIEAARSVPVYTLALTEKGVMVKNEAVDLLYAAMSVLAESGEFVGVYTKAGDRIVAGYGRGVCVDVADMVTESRAVEYAAKASEVSRECKRYVVIARSFMGRSKSLLALAGITIIEADRATRAAQLFRELIRT